MSHIGTPEWQSFELRMLERARLRRETRRRRRVRRATTAAVCLLVAAIAGGVYVDLISEPGSDVREPAGVFAAREFVKPPLPASILNAIAVDPPLAQGEVAASGTALEPEAFLPPPPARPASPTTTAANQPASSASPRPTAGQPPARASTVEAASGSERLSQLESAGRSRPPERVATPNRSASTESPRVADRTIGTAGSEAEASRVLAPAASPTTAATSGEAVEPRAESRPPQAVTDRESIERPPAPEPVGALPERAPDLPPATASTSTPSPAATSVAPPVDHRAGIRETIERYRRAYESLDASAAHAVWPAVREDALARAFSSLASQRILFDSCSIEVTGRLATASCRGTTRVVPRVGGGMQSAKRAWIFWLQQSGDRWVIERTQIR